MSTPRKFTDEFSVADYVSVIRTEHGWHDGQLTARIISLGDFHCMVLDEEGYSHEIRKPRDIVKNKSPEVTIPMPKRQKQNRS